MFYKKQLADAGQAAPVLGYASRRGAMGKLFGRPMTQRIHHALLPHLRWNQEIYGVTISERLKDGSDWLDVGCGHRMLGKDLEYIERNLVNRAKRVVGCDIDQSAMQPHLWISELYVAPAENLPFPDGSFDLVTSNMVFEHVAKPIDALTEITRVLKPGGSLILHTPNLWNYMVYLNHTVGRLLPRALLMDLIFRSEGREEKDVFPTLYRANTVRKLKKLGTQAGLRPVCTRVLTAPQPFLGFFAPLALIQIIGMRMTMTKSFSRFGQTILMVLEKRV
jgi:ubiquinone/menaquinone biosynthesis C-methylase UbiE